MSDGNDRMKSIMTFAVLAGIVALTHISSAPAKLPTPTTTETELHKITRKIGDLIDLMKAEHDEAKAFRESTKPTSYEPVSDADLTYEMTPPGPPLVTLHHVNQIAYTQEDTQKARREAYQRGQEVAPERVQRDVAPSPTVPPVGMQPAVDPPKTVPIAPVTQAPANYYYWHQGGYEACNSCASGWAYTQPGWRQYNGNGQVLMYGNGRRGFFARRADGGGFRPARRLGAFLFGRGC
jgi:hypothetical protein